MIFRLMLILVFYQLVFVGFSIIYFGDFIDIISIVAFLGSFLLAGFFVDSRSKVSGLTELIQRDTTSSILIFSIGILGVLFLVIKFYLYGVPLFREDANFFRVEFARKLDFPSGIIRHLCYLCIIILALKSSNKLLFILTFAMCMVGMLSAYRSAAVLPIILIIFVHFLLWDRGLFLYLKAYKNRILILAAAMIGLMTAITASRFGDINDIQSSLVILSDRIFFHNYVNILRVQEQFLESPLYLESMLWDLKSIFSEQLGFSAVMSKLSGSSNYEFIQMTPTFVGEGMANFGRHYYLHAFLIVYVIFFIRVVLASVKTSIGIGAVLLILVFLPISSGQGFGSYLFSYMPKLVISSSLLYLLYHVIPKKV